MAVYYIVATAEASSNLARYDGMRYGYRADAKDLTETYMLSRDEGLRRRGQTPHHARHLRAFRRLLRRLLSEGAAGAHSDQARLRRGFQTLRRYRTPTAPTTAFKIGEKTQDPLQMYLSDIFTISVNLAGLPALSLPCGFDEDGMPIGLQIIGKPFDESTILRTAYHYEQATEWHKRKPKIED